MRKYCGENIVHRTRIGTSLLALELLASPVTAFAQATERLTKRLFSDDESRFFTEAASSAKKVALQ